MVPSLARCINFIPNTFELRLDFDGGVEAPTDARTLVALIRGEGEREVELD